MPFRPRAERMVVGMAWLLVAALVAHFLSVAYQKYTHVEPGSYGMFWSRREWLWIHLAGGVLTILLGPLQFIGRLRMAYPRLHRWTGRLYLGGVLIGIAGAAGLIATSPAPVAIRVAFAATGLAWLVTAGVGFVAIRSRRTQLHRRWMIRNYLVTLAPASFRLAILVPGMMALAPPNVMIPLLLWLSWALPLMAYEAGLAATQLARGVRSRRYLAT